MPYSQRQFTCPDCGMGVLRRRSNGSVVRCPPCAVSHSAETQRQLNARSGPLYQEWAWANLEAALRALSSPAPGECLIEA